MAAAALKLVAHEPRLLGQGIGTVEQVVERLPDVARLALLHAEFRVQARGGLQRDAAPEYGAQQRRGVGVSEIIPRDERRERPSRGAHLASHDWRR